MNQKPVQWHAGGTVQSKGSGGNRGGARAAGTAQEGAPPASLTRDVLTTGSACQHNGYIHITHQLIELSTSMPTQAEPDWSAWSREAVRLMQERNDAWMRDYSLQGCRYDWSLDEAQLVFTAGNNVVIADICVLGSVSEAKGTFLWAWANEAIPDQARPGLATVREFGESNALELLTKSEWPGARSDGLEMAAVAGRVLDVAGVWIEPIGDVTFFFALSNFRRSPVQS